MEYLAKYKRAKQIKTQAKHLKTNHAELPVKKGHAELPRTTIKDNPSHTTTGEILNVFHHFCHFLKIKFSTKKNS